MKLSQLKIKLVDVVKLLPDFKGRTSSVRTEFQSNLEGEQSIEKVNTLTIKEDIIQPVYKDATAYNQTNQLSEL